MTMIPPYNENSIFLNNIFIYFMYLNNLWNIDVVS